MQRYPPYQVGQPQQGERCSAPYTGSDMWSDVVVHTECTDDEIGIHTLLGVYEVNRRRQGPKIYRKVGGDPVFLYYWDARDSEDFTGWWFGPKVGGDLVWAHHPSNADTPPQTGWRVPWNGEVTPGLLIVDQKEDTPNNEDTSSGSDERIAEWVRQRR